MIKITQELSKPCQNFLRAHKLQTVLKQALAARQRVSKMLIFQAETAVHYDNVPLETSQKHAYEIAKDLISSHLALILRAHTNTRNIQVVVDLLVLPETGCGYCPKYKSCGSKYLDWTEEIMLREIALKSKIDLPRQLKVL